jgi:hypothetical protein
VRIAVAQGGIEADLLQRGVDERAALGRRGADAARIRAMAEELAALLRAELGAG